MFALSSDKGQRNSLSRSLSLSVSKPLTRTWFEELLVSPGERAECDGRPVLEPLLRGLRLWNQKYFNG